MRQEFLAYMRESAAVLRDSAPWNPADTERGFRGVRSSNDPRYLANLAEAMKLYGKVLKGDKWAALRMQEALTMSDFSTYFQDIIDRQVLAGYAETPYTWGEYIKKATIQDFRAQRILRFDRGDSVLDGPLNRNSDGASGAGSTGLDEASGYPQRRRTVSGYTDQLYKFGARMDFAWETMIGDDLDALKDTPMLFGRAARRTEEKRATDLYVNSTGPDSTFFSNANLNLVNGTVASFVTTNNPVLSITALGWALTIMAMQKDSDGEPISIAGAVLVVPPALDIAARNIVNAIEVYMNDTGGTADASGDSLQRLKAPNWARGRVRVAVNSYLPIVNTTSGNTAWYVFADPNIGRPAAQLSFLRGREAPELFMKAPNAMAIGGGAGNVMDGDFDSDSIAYKVRHVIGGTLLDPKMAVASTGAGS